MAAFLLNVSRRAEERAFACKIRDLNLIFKIGSDKTFVFAIEVKFDLRGQKSFLKKVAHLTKKLL